MVKNGLYFFFRAFGGSFEAQTLLPVGFAGTPMIYHPLTLPIFAIK